MQNTAFIRFIIKYKPPILAFLSVLSLLTALGFRPASLRLGEVLKAVGVSSPSIVSPLNLVTVASVPILIATMYFLAMEIRHRGLTVAVLQQQITLEYLTPDGREFRYHEKSKVYAYKPDVRSLYHSFRTASGKIPPTRMISSASHAHSNLRRFGNYEELKHWDIFQEFGSPLPWNFIQTRKNAVDISIEVVSVDSFTRRNEWFDLEAASYPKRDVTVTVIFRNENPKVRCECWAISHNDSVDQILPKSDSSTRCEFYISKMLHKRYRFEWETQQGVV